MQKKLEIFFDMLSEEYNVYGDAQKSRLKVFGETMNGASKSEALCIETTGNDFAILKAGSISDLHRRMSETQDSNIKIFSGKSLERFLEEDAEALENSEQPSLA